MFKCLMINVSSRGGPRPLGVYRIAHYLREHNWDVEVIEFGRTWTFEELKQLATSRIDKNTKFIGFGHLFSIWTEDLEKFCLWVKITYPEVILLSGGSVAPEFESNAIDYYIKGFGEYAIIALLEWLFSNGPRPRFEISKYNGRNLIYATHNYPAFPMQSLMVKYEDRDFIRSDEWLLVEFSRGCRFQCAYCNFPVLGVKDDYTRSAEDFREQVMDAYDRFGIINYMVTDDTFNDRTEKITKFADVVETLPFRPFFTGCNRADLLVTRKHDKEELARMNFGGHFYGIESFNHTALKAIGKGMHPDKIKQGLIDIKNYFENNGSKQYRGTITFIIGLPGESEQDIADSKRWLKENWKGQNYSCNTLEIPVGDKAHPSLMGADYEKYGYRPSAKSIPVENDQDDLLFFKDRLIWENDYMDYYRALEIAKDLMDSRDENVTIGNLELAHMGLPLTVEQRLALRQDEQFNLTYHQRRQEIIQNYKQKKLGL